MLILFLVALVFAAGGYTDDRSFVTQTVAFGEDVTLTCSRRSESQGYLFWNRLVGNFPEVLAATYTFDHAAVNKTPHITAKQEPGSFVLHITHTELSDTGFYYCQEIIELQTRYVNITFLIVKGPEPAGYRNITAVIQDDPSDPVSPGDPVTLQCSVLSDPQIKTCPGDKSVFWFRAGSQESHPSLIYVHANSSDDCKRSPEARSPHKCVYNFSKNVSSTDAGTYYCAVATCGQILFGNGLKLEIEASCDSKTNTALFLLSVALTISLIVISFLIYTIKKQKCECFTATDAMQENAALTNTDQPSQQTNEDSVIYSVPNFTQKKVGRNVKRGGNSVEGESIYSDVRVLGHE